MTVTTDKKVKNSKKNTDDDVFDTVKAESADAAAEELTEDTGDEPTEAADADDESRSEGKVVGESERPKPSMASRLSPKVLAGALVLVLLVGGCGFLGWKLLQAHQVSQAAQQAQAAAVSYAGVLTSIDSDKVDENFNQVLAGSTGEFRDMYSKSSVQLRQLLIDNKATAHGVVVESAVQSATKDKVVVLLFVDQSVSNTSVPDPRIDRSRIKMTLEKVDGQWRTSKVELP